METIEQDRARAGLPWLTRLRWGLVGGELAAVALAAFVFGVAIQPGRVLTLIGLSALTNVLLLWKLERSRLLPRRLCAAVFCFDTLLLTALLACTGGPTNPFSVLYLVLITLAALLLSPRWTWALTLLCVLGYGALFFVHGAAGVDHSAHMGAEYASHLQGMWLAFTLTAALTASSVGRLTAEIERRDREIETIREQAERSERVAALTTLAAGAAHELGTPLATIAVAAGELERQASKISGPGAAGLAEDAGLILSQLARCRQILDQMSAAAGEIRGETPSPRSLAEVLEELRSGLAPAEAERLVLHVRSQETAVLPHRALGRVLHSLLRNAFDAGPDGAAVEVTVSRDDAGLLRVEVADRGPGMTADVLARATDPFFTTKAAGRGMGMGLFLARTLAEQLGGRLLLASTVGIGTTATLELPGDGVRSHGGRGPDPTEVR